MNGYFCPGDGIEMQLIPNSRSGYRVEEYTWSYHPPESENSDNRVNAIVIEGQPLRSSYCVR